MRRTPEDLDDKVMGLLTPNLKKDIVALRKEISRRVLEMENEEKAFKHRMAALKAWKTMMERKLEKMLAVWRK